MRQVECDAEERPAAEQGRFVVRPGLVEAEDAHYGEVQSVQNGSTSSEVVEFLSHWKITRVENHAERPAREAKVAEGKVVFAQGVRGRDRRADALHAILVREIVEQRKQDGEDFLDAEDAVEGPFSVILHDGLEHWGVAGDAPVGYDVLAGVVAFGGTVPEEEAEMEGWSC